MGGQRKVSISKKTSGRNRSKRSSKDLLLMTFKIWLPILPTKIGAGTEIAEIEAVGVPDPLGYNWQSC